MLEKEVLEYCKANNIPIKDGMVSQTNVTKIKAFVEKCRNRNRIATRQREWDEDIKIVNCMLHYLNGLAGKIIWSPIENYLWQALKKEGLTKDAKTQYPIGKYEIDIAYPEIKLAVECDGVEYHKGDRRQIEHDQIRDKVLARKGWRTLRITGVEIRRDIFACVEKVKFLVKRV